MTDHPDDASLREWLETGRPAQVERHLDAGCEACLERLDALTDLGELREGLATASLPPEDLHRRTTGSVQGRLAAEDAVVTFLDLFTLPWHTAGVLFGSHRGPARPVDGPSRAEHHSPDDGDDT